MSKTVRVEIASPKAVGGAVVRLTLRYDGEGVVLVDEDTDLYILSVTPDGIRRYGSTTALGLPTDSRGRILDITSPC